MKKIVRLTESDLVRIIKRVISEQSNDVNIPMVWELSKKLGLKYSTPNGPDQVFFHYGNNPSWSKQQIWVDITNNKPMTITIQDERGVKEFPASTPIDKIVNYAKGSTNYKKLTDSEPKDSIKEQLKRVIQEEITEDKLNVDPFVLWASEKGNVWIKNTSTNKQMPYKMSVYVKLVWVDCDIVDFPGGTKMEIKVLGQDKKIPVDKNGLRNLLTKNFGKSEIIQKFGENDVKFTKVS